MVIKNAKFTKSMHSRPTTLAAAILLFLYIAGNVQLESFHQLFHSFHEITHSKQEEQDPCHRAIYHESISEGCDHETHITAIKNCPLCHVVPLNEQHLATSHSFVSIPSVDLFHPSIFESKASNYLVNPTTRGPPQL